jgi:two-component system, LuxR family, sensor kinase FixL
MTSRHTYLKPGDGPDMRKTGKLTSIKADLHTVMETVLDGLIIIDSDGLIQTFNLAAEKIFGYTPEEVIGRNVNMLMPEPYHSQHDGYLSHYLKTGEKKVIGIGREVSGRRKNGSVFPMELGINEMPVGGSRMFVGTIRDITERKEAEERAVEEAARVMAITNTVLDGLITINEQGLIQTFNPAAEKIFGYTQEEVFGQNVMMLMPEPYYSQGDSYLRHYLKTKVNKVIGIGREISGRRKDGSVFPMELGINEMPVGGERMFVGTARDITERKKAEERAVEEAARWLAITNTVLDGLITINEQGEIQTFNPAAEYIFGYTQEEVIGQNLNLLVPQSTAQRRVHYFKDYLRTGEKKVLGVRREFYGVRKDGTRFPMEFDFNEMPLGGERMFVGTLRDITGRKEDERKILQHIEALKHSNQELDDFAFIASHDLREPLRGLSNNAMFLYEDFAEQLGKDGEARLLRMTYLCERMERLVNDLLYFSRLGRQELAIQKTDLNEIISDIESLMETTLQQVNARIVIPKPLPVIVCDLPRITEVFRNLITNAVKYNDKPEKIVEISCEDKSGERVFCVRDNGVGIPLQFHNDVFRLFKRLNNEDDSVKGTGAGLTFVKKILERHHGRIWIESQMGQGTAFYFTIGQGEQT